MLRSSHNHGTLKLPNDDEPQLKEVGKSSSIRFIHRFPASIIITYSSLSFRLIIYNTMYKMAYETKAYITIVVVDEKESDSIADAMVCA